MSDEKGYIKLYRGIRENEVIWEERATKLQAWIDLLLMANYKDKTIVKGLRKIEIKRGSFVTSYPKLGERWGWDKRTAKSFLSLLKDEGMVTLNVDNHGITVNIVNYCKYQGFLENDVPQNVPQIVPQNVPQDALHDVPRIVPNEEYKESSKNRKERKRNNKPPISPFEELEKTDFSERIKGCLREWFEYKKQMKEKSYQTEMGYKKFITQVKNAVESCGEEKVVNQFDYAMSRGWSGAYLEKIVPEKKNDFTLDDVLKELSKDGE